LQRFFDGLKKGSRIQGVADSSTFAPFFSLFTYHCLLDGMPPDALRQQSPAQAKAPVHPSCICQKQQDTGYENCILKAGLKATAHLRAGRFFYFALKDQEPGSQI
jgi:hypothetical protein